ncbi:TPA: hypothetical protein ACXIPG_001345 [Neisseria meningitidis]|uniref:hypothetical protein n=1 Tax=Neisseria meningitidis TaxID=487 RepID=UPI001E3018EE|nr:hypothetical protein [Neisseria meningitidis]
MSIIKIDDFRRNRKRRIVDDDLARVILGLVVAARIKRAHDFQPVGNADFLLYPFQHRRVNGRRRVAVVGRLFRLELFNKAPP